jgi:hypothetical protein
MGQEFRIDWKVDESLAQYQERVRSRDRANVRDYEAKRFSEGLMYIEWTSFRPASYTHYHPKNELESEIIKSLSSGTREFIFDEHRRLWKPGKLHHEIAGLFMRMNQRMSAFLKEFDGKYLLLDAMAQDQTYRKGRFVTTWAVNSGRVSWFLKAPKA